MEFLNIIICLLLLNNEAQAGDEWPLAQADQSGNITAQVTSLKALLAFLRGGSFLYASSKSFKVLIPSRSSIRSDAQLQIRRQVFVN